MEHSVIQASAAIGAQPSFTVARAAILPALDIIARRIVERRNTIPILSNVLIEADPAGFVRLTATNLDLELEATLSAEVDQPGATTVCAFTLRDIVKKASVDAMIRIDAGDGLAMIYHGRGKQSLPTLPRDDFPIMAMRGDYTLSGEFDALQLASDLAAIKPAICKEETRYYLRGIHFGMHGDAFCMAATNGHAMHVIERDAGRIVTDNFAGGIIYEGAIVAMLAALKGSGPGSVALDMSASKFRLDCGDIIIRGKLIDGTFPDYRRCIPTAESLSATLSVESKELLAHCATAKAQDGKVKALRVECEGGAIMAGVTGANGFARPLPAEYDGQDCGFSVGAGFMGEFTKLGDHLTLQCATLDGDRDACPILIKCPDMPEFTGVLMPVRNDGELPKPRAVAYPVTLPAPGQAADLFGVEKPRRVTDGAAHYSTGYLIGINEGPRAATSAELEAYARDYAARLGLNVGDWDMTTAKDDNRGRTVAVNFSNGAVEGMEKSVTVLLPGYGQDRSPVTVQWQDDAGEYGAPELCTDAKGQIALPDAPKVRKAKAVKPVAESHRLQNTSPQETATALYAKHGVDVAPISEAETVAPVSGECEAPQSAPETQEMDAPATQAYPEPEIALYGQEIQPETASEPVSDPIAEIMARLDALEAVITNATTIEAAKVIATPSGAMETDVALPVQSKPKRTAAHVRAIMAYLAARKLRAELVWRKADWKKALDLGNAVHDELIAERNAAREECADWEALQLRTWEQSMGYKMQRRRAVLKARDLQKRFHVERRLTSSARAEIAEMKRKLADPLNPWRECDVLSMRDQAATFQARAERAEQESLRLRNLALQNAGHIETLASRIAKAESMLREQGLWPTLTIAAPAPLVGIAA